MARPLQLFWGKAFEKATDHRRDFVEEGNRTMKFLPLSGILLLSFGLSLGTPALRAKEARPAPAAKASGGNSPFGDVIEVNVVNVDVTATDDKGRPVSGLKKGDFELLEDGKAVAVSNFETVTAAAAGAPVTGPASAAAASPASPPSPDDALNLVVFFDNFNLRPPHRARVLRQLHEFLARQLGPADRVMVVSYDGGGPHVRVPFTGDPAAIAAGLKTLETLVTHGDESDRDRRQALDTMMAIQRNSLLDPDPIPCPINIVTPAEAYASTRRHEVLQAVGALTLLVNSLSGVPGRKAVLHVSDGLPLCSPARKRSSTWSSSAAATAPRASAPPSARPAQPGKRRSGERRNRRLQRTIRTCRRSMTPPRSTPGRTRRPRRRRSTPSTTASPRTSRRSPRTPTPTG